jgi:hypothetical protein
MVFFHRVRLGGGVRTLFGAIKGYFRNSPATLVERPNAAGVVQTERRDTATDSAAKKRWAAPCTPTLRWPARALFSRQQPYAREAVPTVNHRCASSVSMLCIFLWSANAAPFGRIAWEAGVRMTRFPAESATRSAGTRPSTSVSLYRHSTLGDAIRAL